MRIFCCWRVVERKNRSEKGSNFDDSNTNCIYRTDRMYPGDPRANQTCLGNHPGFV